MATFETISNSPQMLSRLFGHLKYFIEFKCPNSNTYDLIQKSRIASKNMKPFLAEGLARTKDGGHL